MGLEKYMEGNIAPLPDEIEKARKEGGEEAVIALKEKMKQANSKLQAQNSEEAIKSLEAEFNKN